MKRHTPAFQSPLWPHLEAIRSWRRARLTWREITERLNKEHGVGLTLQAVHTFFKKASKRSEPPLGFTSLPGQPEQPLKPPKVADDHAKKTTKETGHTYEQWEAEERKKAKNQPFKTYNPNSNPSE